MPPRSFRLALLLFLVGAVLSPSARASCGAESCPLDNSTFGGRARQFSFELSYQHVNQDQLRTGTHSADEADVLIHGGEVRTRSRITMAKAYASLGSRWLVTASLPYVERMHQHVTAEGLPEPELREWQYAGLGDLMLLGSWTAFGSPSSLTLALQGGVRLPTGRRNVPEIDGEQPEPHARPGSGSTDLMAGVQVVQPISLPMLGENVRPTVVFASALYTHTGHGTDEHRIGRSIEGHVGAAYPLLDRLSVLGQFNVRSRGKDHTNATEAAGGGHDHIVYAVSRVAHEGEAHGGFDDNTGGTTVYATPGLRYDLGAGMVAGGYVQVPVYQRVNGTQIVAPSQFWFGLTYRLR